jgi:ribosomal protein S18 acetylase RimI-like enzyme
MLQSLRLEDAEFMEIRPATAEDHASITMLEAEIQTQHHEGAPFIFPPTGVIPYDEYLALLARPNEGVLIALENGAAAGYLNYELIDRGANYYTYGEKLLHVHVLTVKASHRGRKIGEALMERAEEIGREFGASRMTLEVYAFNEGAVRFYERNGFGKLKHMMSKSLTEDKP